MLPFVIDNYCMEYMDLLSLEMVSVMQVKYRYQCHFRGSCVYWIHNKCNGMKGTMCPCPDFNCASCLGLASPMDGTENLTEVEFGDEKKQREKTHQEVSIEVLQT